MKKSILQRVGHLLLAVIAGAGIALILVYLEIASIPSAARLNQFDWIVLLGTVVAPALWMLALVLFGIAQFGAAFSLFDGEVNAASTDPTKGAAVRQPIVKRAGRVALTVLAFTGSALIANCGMEFLDGAAFGTGTWLSNLTLSLGLALAIGVGSTALLYLGATQLLRTWPPRNIEEVPSEAAIAQH